MRLDALPPATAARVDYSENCPATKALPGLARGSVRRLLGEDIIFTNDVVDIPVAYRSRTYGTTNIHRFRDGFRLLRMALTGVVRFRMGGGA